MSGKAKAICYMIFSSGSFAFMNAFVRLAGDMPSVEKSFFRNLVAAFVALAILLREGQGFAIKKGTLPFHLGRSIVGTIGIAFSKAGAIVIPAGEATISLSGLAVASLVGIILNAILPGKDYEFGVDEQGDTSVNFKV